MTINSLIAYQKFREKYLCVELNNINLDEDTIMKNWEELNHDYNLNPVLPDLFYNVIQENYHPFKCGRYKYSEFLKTKYWKIISTYLRYTINKCEFQYSHDNTHLNIHHRTYDILGKELQSLSDLVCLCEECHSKFHNKEYKHSKINSEYVSKLKLDSLDKKINELITINNISNSIDSLIIPFNNSINDNVFIYLKNEYNKIEIVLNNLIHE